MTHNIPNMAIVMKGMKTSQKVSIWYLFESKTI